MLNQILSQRNLNNAYLQVYRNKGVGGVDNLGVEELKDHLQTHGQRYIEAIRNGRYQVAAIKGVEIPKSNGKPDYWVFRQLLTGYSNKRYNKYYNLCLKAISKTIVTDFVLNGTLTKLFDKVFKISMINTKM